MRRRISTSSLLLALVLGTAPPSADARSARKSKVSASGAVALESPRAGMSAVDDNATAVIDTDTIVSSAPEPQNLNQTEMLSLVKKYAGEIASAVVDGERQREEAVRQRDSIKLSCVQDRLSNMKMMKKLSDNRLEAAARPSVRADDLSLRHEFRGVEMARERVLELHRELIECAGGNLEIASGTTSEPSGTAIGGSTDPSGTNVDTTPVDRPIPASVYK